jgi:hypothetical protein
MQRRANRKNSVRFAIVSNRHSRHNAASPTIPLAWIRVFLPEIMALFVENAAICAVSAHVAVKEK